MEHIHHIVRSNPTLGRLAIMAIPDVRWNVAVNGIGPMMINLRRNRSYWLRDPLMHESFMLGALQRLIRPGDTVFDAGANIGLYVRFMLQQFRAGKVVAFEPMSQNLPYLKRNIEFADEHVRVQVVPAALADYDGTDDFQLDDLSSASATLNVVAGGEACQGRRQYGLPPMAEPVTVSRLDTLVERGVIPVPNVIKMDVEGAEERVLRGASRTLEQHSPKIAVELHGTEVTRAVVRFLLDAEYSVFGYLSAGGGRRAYQEIMAANISDITGKFSLHHCIAARDRELLREPVAYSP